MRRGNRTQRRRFRFKVLGIAVKVFYLLITPAHYIFITHNDKRRAERLFGHLELFGITQQIPHIIALADIQPFNVIIPVIAADIFLSVFAMRAAGLRKDINPVGGGFFFAGAERHGRSQGMKAR